MKKVIAKLRERGENYEMYNIFQNYIIENIKIISEVEYILFK